MNIIAEYIWLGGSNELRCKTRVLKIDAIDLINIPLWDYDGSSTNQATCDKSEVILKPVALYRDPFRLPQDIIVLCSTYNMNDEPIDNNQRDWAVNIFNKYIFPLPSF